MSNKKINIGELLQASSMITRQGACELYNLISKLPENNITLDFSQILYASRSFFDELNNFQNILKSQGKKVEYININEDLQPLLQIVINSAKSRKRISYEDLSNVKVINI